LDEALSKSRSSFEDLKEPIDSHIKDFCHTINASNLYESKTTRAQTIRNMDQSNYSNRNEIWRQQTMPIENVCVCRSQETLGYFLCFLNKGSTSQLRG